MDRTLSRRSEKPKCPHPEIALLVEQYGEATCAECGQVGPGMVIGDLPPLPPTPMAGGWLVKPVWLLIWRRLRRKTA